MKVVLLIWYSNKNFGFRKIELYLASNINSEIWKCLIFDGTASIYPTKHKQTFSVYSFGCKNVLNFSCLPMNLHNRGHANQHVVRYIGELKEMSSQINHFFHIPKSLCLVLILVVN